MNREFQIAGMADLAKALKDLGEETGMKALVASGRKAFEPVLEEAKRLAPYDEKAPGPHLRDQLALTTKKAGYIGGDVVATVGIKIKNVPNARKLSRANRHARDMGVSLKDRQDAGLSPKNPRRYWHLVEFGTSRTAGKPFLRLAFDYRVEHALAVLQVELRKRIDRAWRRRLKGF